MSYLLIIFYILLGLIIAKIIFDSFQKKKTPALKSVKVISSSTPKEGVNVDVLKEGSGNPAVSGKVVRVHYNAFLTNGKKVDSSYDKNEVFSFTMGRRQVIPGWEAGMIGMKEGEIRKFTISPDQAYGAKGKANVPPNATMIFEVELLKVI